MSLLVVVGAGGHAKVVIDAARLMNFWTDIKIIDANYNKGEKILGADFIGDLNQISTLNLLKTNFIIAVGDNKKRKEIFDFLFNFDVIFENVIHPLSNISNSAKLGSGNYIGPFANIGPEVKIGNQNIINSYANVEHEVMIGSFSQIAPNSVLCGKSKISDNVFIGANSTIIERIVIQENIFIGASSLVIDNNLKPNLRYAGVPAKII